MRVVVQARQRGLPAVPARVAAVAQEGLADAAVVRDVLGQRERPVQLRMRNPNNYLTGPAPAHRYPDRADPARGYIFRKISDCIRWTSKSE